MLTTCDLVLLDASRYETILDCSNADGSEDLVTLQSKARGSRVAPAAGKDPASNMVGLDLVVPRRSLTMHEAAPRTPCPGPFPVAPRSAAPFPVALRSGGREGPGTRQLGGGNGTLFEPLLGLLTRESRLVRPPTSSKFDGLEGLPRDPLGGDGTTFEPPQ